MNITKKLSQINNFFNTSKVLPLCIWLLYVIFLCVVSYYHEPWHDEGQAWLIARDDSLWHLITYTTHLEGHPPLWHLCLMPFAKLGVPFELGLKSVNIFFCAAAMWLLIVKSPLAWYWRFCLPFSYFVFYQFGIVNRTYSLLMFAIMLAAYYYPRKTEKPWPLACALILLSGAQAYGMMVACGIALAWFIAICKSAKDKCGKLQLSNLWQQQQCQALLLLLVVAAFFAYTMIPLRETSFTNIASTKRGVFWQNLFFCVFVMPGQLFCEMDFKDTVFDESFTFFWMNLHKYWDLNKAYGIYAYILVVQSLIKYFYGLMVQLVLGYVSFFMGLGWLFVLPEICFFSLASLVFLRTHHIGILACFYIFILWQIYAEPSAKLQLLQEHFQKMFTTIREYQVIRIFIYCIFAGILAINIKWSVKDSLVDIKTPYDMSRGVADFIRINKMQDLRFWVSWEYSDDGKYVTMGAFDINAYFKKPFIENLNGGLNHYGFLEYRVWDKDVFDNNLKRMGPPDIYIGNMPTNMIFKKLPEYVPIQKFEWYRLVKENVEAGQSFMYMRKDLLPWYPQLHELTKEEIEAPLKY